MENKNYRGLRKTLIALLGDLERAKKRCEKANNISQTIGGPMRKQTWSLMGKFDKLAQSVLKLEQETREI